MASLQNYLNITSRRQTGIKWGQSRPRLWYLVHTMHTKPEKSARCSPRWQQTFSQWRLIVVYLTSSCVNWGFFWHEWASLKRSFHSRFTMAHSCQKTPNLHKNELNTTFFYSTSLLKAPNRLKSLKLA
jgi:hypothetical protein